MAMGADQLQQMLPKSISEKGFQDALPGAKSAADKAKDTLQTTQAVGASVSAAALPQVTMPQGAPVSAAIRRPAPSISSSRLTKARDASATAARTSGSIRLPECAVRTDAQLMNGRTPKVR